MSSKTKFHSLGSSLQMTEKPINLMIVQLGQTSKDKEKNILHAEKTIKEAISKTKTKPQMVILPECWNSPYGIEYFEKYAEDFDGLYEKIKSPINKNIEILKTKDLINKENFNEQDAIESRQKLLESKWTIDGFNKKSINVENSKSQTIKFMSNLAKEFKLILIGGSIPEKDLKTGNLYNTSTVFNETGNLISIHRKLHLFDIDIPNKITFQESKTLTEGDRITLFDCSLGRFGLAICYDLRFPEIALISSRLGAAGIIYPGAFNTTTGPKFWELLQRSRALDNQFYVISCSPSRPSKEEIEQKKSYPSYGFSMVIDPFGQILKSLDEKESILEIEINKNLIKESRKFIPISNQRRFDVYGDIVDY